MATWDDVRRIAMALPAVTEGSSFDGQLTWKVRDKGFVWERPLRKADHEALDAAPDGPILGAWVPDVGAQQALVSADPEVFFVTPHFEGYPAVLILLDQIGEAELAEVVTEAWTVKAPKRLAKEYFEAQG